ncbi:MAG: hypothetical protein AB1810_13660 [Pseudomonadota bacterium]
MMQCARLCGVAMYYTGMADMPGFRHIRLWLSAAKRTNLDRITQGARSDIHRGLCRDPALAHALPFHAPGEGI